HDSAVAFQGHIDQLREAPITQVRIAVSNLVAEVVPGLIAEQVASHDGTRVDLVVTHDVLNLLQREADIAIRHVRPHQQELICKRIGALPMGVYAHPKYCEKYGPLESSNVADHRFIEGLGRDHLTEGAAREGIEILPEQISFRTDSLTCQRAAVESAWGMAVFPKWMAESHWVPMFEDAVMDVEVWLVARPEVRDNQPLKKLFRALGEALERHLLQPQPR
ncbi:MAG: DNA-binding transcriptional LysR family regulator, partial [Limisphaerales bacterium]